MGLISSQYARIPCNYYVDMKRAQQAALMPIARKVRLANFNNKPRLVKAAK